MIHVTNLLPGVTLRYAQEDRFKQGAVSIQFVRPMCREEAALNSLLPSVLLRGSRFHPNMRTITRKLDDLYGAAVSAMVRRIGDGQTTGLVCGFIEDRYAMPGDEILRPMLAFLEELLFRPVTENGVFSREYVAGEKVNLISAMESQRNDKRIYASSRMLKLMCPEDSFGVPRLGEKEQVETITPENLFAHYRKVLTESPVEVFYVGTAPEETVAALIKKMFADIPRNPGPMPVQTPYHVTEKRDETEVMDLAQAKLCMGFYTPITNQDPRFAAMQVLNAVFGAGMTSKLFMVIREKMSLCYSIGSGYYGSKGIMTVSAGIDSDQGDRVRNEIMKQLEACQNGKITPEELDSAKKALLSSLQTVHDSPGAIEGYYMTAAISGQRMSPDEYMEAIEKVTAEQTAEAARTLQLHTVFFLKGGKA